MKKLEIKCAGCLNYDCNCRRCRRKKYVCGVVKYGDCSFNEEDDDCLAFIQITTA